MTTRHDANNRAITLCYEIEGQPDRPPLLLIPGLGMQLIDWPDHFVDGLAEHHRVIRMDNRDRGLSTSLDGAPHDAGALMAAMFAGSEPALAYTLSDMAADAVAVLDAAQVEAAHLVGVSMGGMIAQTVAIEHSQRVRSLTSIMSSTGAPDVGQPKPEALEAILSVPPEPTREATIAHGAVAMRSWGSPDHYDPDEVPALLARSWDRVDGNQAQGTARQLCAIIASPARDAALRQLELPALVVHGSADALIDPSGGDRTAACIPGAELLRLEGMGHDLPRAFTPRIIEAIAQLVARTPSSVAG